MILEVALYQYRDQNSYIFIHHPFHCSIHTRICAASSANFFLDIFLSFFNSLDNAIRAELLNPAHSNYNTLPLFKFKCYNYCVTMICLLDPALAREFSSLFVSVRLNGFAYSWRRRLHSGLIWLLL